MHKIIYFSLFLLIKLFFLNTAHSQCEQTEVTIISTTVNWGSEMSWELHNSEGTLVAEWQGVNDNETSTLEVCLPDGCYLLTARDSYGDGWNGGSVAIDWEDSSVSFELPDGNLDYFYFGINETDCIPEVPGCTDPTAYNYDPQATINDGSCMSLSDIITAQVFDTICYSGPKDNRVSFVIQNRSTPNSNNNFADADDLRNGLEENFIPAFTLNHPGAKMPYARYKNFFNLYAAWWPDAPGDHTWWNFNVIKDLRDELFLPWANEETGWVTWFSTTKFGGGGGAGRDREARVGDGKMFGTDFETLLHEFGHTMPGLPDEYTSSGVWSNNQCFESGNTTAYTIKDSIPWRKWIEEDTPLPTPYNGEYEDVIGVFEGGLTNYFGCYRPTAKGCYMGAGGFGEGYGQDLCSPCVQRTICFLYKYVNVIENPVPAETSLSVNGNETITFSADVVAPEPNTQKYEWFLNGKLIATNTTSVEVNFGACDQYELKFAVTDTTDLVRYDEKFQETYPKPYREFVWTIEQSDVNSYDLEVSSLVMDANCTGENNATVNFDVAGGQAPYELWLDGALVNNPAEELASGQYDFTIVDANGCSKEEMVTIGQEPLLDLEICSENEGTWEVSVQSENYDIADLDLEWSTGDTGPILTDVPDGEYTLTASINDCEVSETFTLLTTPEDLQVSDQFFPSELGGNTGTIYVEVNGGAPDYQIKWYDRLMDDQTDDNTDNIIASGTTWDHLPEMAFDDDLTTKWLHAVPENAWVAYEFPSPTAIAYYAITSADDVPARDPKDWIFQGSNDGNTWIPLDQRNNEDFPNRFQRRTFPINNTGSYTYYRLYVTSSAGENQIQLQELEFIGADPEEPFTYNPEFDNHFSRTGLAPGEYHYEIQDASWACAEEDIQIGIYFPFEATALTVIQDGNCGVTIENPNPDYQYYWLSDEIGQELLGTGLSFEPPLSGNYYVTAGPSGTNQWSSNRRGFAVTMPDQPMVDNLGDGTLVVTDPKPDEEYLWYESDDCGSPIYVGTEFIPAPEAAQYWIAARSTIEYPDPIDPADVSGLLLQMDASDLNGDGQIDNPAPPTSSILNWYFPTGNNWDLDNWFAYRSNYQNGLGIADWATLWLQRIENGQSGFQTVLMAYEENALSWDQTGPMQALSTTIPRHSDASQLLSDTAPATTLNGSTYLNGQLVDPLSTPNPLEFCILGSVFTVPSNAEILYTDTHWEGKVGEMLFFDHALTEEEMLGISEHLRQKWISTAELESPRTPYQWEGIVAAEETLSEQKVRIFPNPANDHLFLKAELPGELTIRIFDLHGKLIHSQQVTNTPGKINVSAWAEGFYLLEISDQNGYFEVQRFVKI